MKYWQLKASKEGLTVYSNFEVDYIDEKVVADATGKDRGIKGQLNDDYPLFLSAPGEVFSQRLAKVIADLDLEGIAIYPITLTLPDGSKNQDWCDINVFSYVDCIDFQASTLKLRENGSIRRIKYLAVDTEKAQRAGYDIFRLHHRFTTVIVSDRFKEAIEAVNPIGIRFFPTDGSEYKGN